MFASKLFKLQSCMMINFMILWVFIESNGLSLQ